MKKASKKLRPSKRRLSSKSIERKNPTKLKLSQKPQLSLPEAVWNDEVKNTVKPPKQLIKTKVYSLAEALGLAVKSSTAKFDSTLSYMFA